MLLRLQERLNRNIVHFKGIIGNNFIQILIALPGKTFIIVGQKPSTNSDNETVVHFLILSHNYAKIV